MLKPSVINVKRYGIAKVFEAERRPLWSGPHRGAPRVRNDGSKMRPVALPGNCQKPRSFLNLPIAKIGSAASRRRFQSSSDRCVLAAATTVLFVDITGCPLERRCHGSQANHVSRPTCLLGFFHELSSTTAPLVRQLVEVGLDFAAHCSPSVPWPVVAYLPDSEVELVVHGPQCRHAPFKGHDVFADVVVRIRWKVFLGEAESPSRCCEDRKRFREASEQGIELSPRSAARTLLGTCRLHFPRIRRAGFLSPARMTELGTHGAPLTQVCVVSRPSALLRGRAAPWQPKREVGGTGGGAQSAIRRQMTYFQGLADRLDGLPPTNPSSHDVPAAEDSGRRSGIESRPSTGIAERPNVTRASQRAA